MNRRQEMVRHMESFTGAAFISQRQLSQFLGFCERSVRDKMAGLPRYEGRYYCKDVVDRIIERSEA